MTGGRLRFDRVRALFIVLLAALATIGTGRTAFAHTDFESSAPADGDIVDGPLTEVVVNFTNPARPAGEGFELLDPNGTVRTPSSIDETDGTSFVLAFDPPLGTGTYGLRWSVRAGDAHPISGSFRFEIIGADPTSTLAPATTTPTSSTPASSAPASSIPATTAPALAAPTTTAAAGAGDAGSPPTTDAATGGASLEEFLDAGTTGGGSSTIGQVGRTMSMLGAIFGIGVLAALIWTIRGRRHELATQLTWIRLSGLVVFAGGLIEYAALAESDPAASFGTLMTTKAGLATALKMVGGVAVLVGFHRHAGRIVAPTHALSAAPATGVAPRGAVEPDAPPRPDLDPFGHRWTPTSTAALGLFGCALVLASFWFDGHTVSTGPWAIHALVNSVHLVAASVWVGGVFAMTTVAWMRRRRSERLGLAATVVRFSSIAAVSLVAVTVAGLVMTSMVLRSPSDLVDTEWGRVMIAKSAAVAVAAGLGGYNHFRLRPALEQRPDDPHLAKELRVSLSIESAVFVVVVVLTAVLVASAT